MWWFFALARGYVFAQVLVIGTAACISTAAWGVELHVALTGDDANPGTKAKPFATLERARDAIRELKRGAGGLPDGGVMVLVGGGIYSRHTTFHLTAEDSGRPDAPVVYRSLPGEEAVLSGMTEVSGEWFAPVTDKTILDRLIDPASRGRLLSCDLRSHGVTDYGELSRRGHEVSRPEITKLPPAELHIGGERMTRARWPNPNEHHPTFLRGIQKQRRGVVGRTGIADKGPTAKDADFMHRGGTIRYAFDRPEKWRESDDIWLSGVFTWSWQWSYNRVAAIDVAKREITLCYGERNGIEDKYSFDYFFVENLLEEIDVPGEYYLDRKTGMLYLLPPESFASPSTGISLSALSTPMVALSQASHVRIQDLVLEGGRSDAITCGGGEQVLIERCEIRNFSGGGVSLEGRNHGVRGCHIHHVGSFGVGLRGGDFTTLKPGGMFVEHCDIHHFAWLHPVYAPAVGLGYRSVGSRVSHNRIHRGPHVAITVYGNDHLIEGNDIGRVVEEFTDMGAIYTNLGKWPLERGTIVRHNYFHDIGREHHLQNAIYTDNCTMGWLIEGNVFHRIGGVGEARYSRAVNNNSGSFIVTRHNAFIDCTLPYVMGNYCARPDLHESYRKAWEAYFQNHDLARLPHAAKYPEVLQFWEEPRQYPDSNRFEGNLIYNPTVPLTRRVGSLEMREGAIVEDGGSLRLGNNWVTDADPGFVNTDAGEFRLSSDAEVFRKIMGFAPIPFAAIGPDHDILRQ